MTRFQVVVSKDDRDWHSIRDDERRALFRVAEHMMADDSDLNTFTAGANIRNALLFGAAFEQVVKSIYGLGFTVTVKKIIE